MGEPLTRRVYEVSAGLDVEEMNKTIAARILGYTPLILEKCESDAKFSVEDVSFEVDETHALLVHIEDENEATGERSYRVSAGDAAIELLEGETFSPVTVDQTNAASYLTDLETALITGERAILQESL